MNMIIIPDIHGRTFWENAVHNNENELIIFLGDYHDPYPYEGILKKDSIENFKKIIEFKKEHKDNVILLLGNHDCHYLFHKEIYCRFDYNNHLEIEKIFNENRDLFQFTFETEINGQKYIFSHAGIKKGWLSIISHLFKIDATIDNISNILNDLYLSNDNKLFDYVNVISKHRGGWGKHGSLIWADIFEHMNTNIDNVYQVFGHSQQEKDPIITDNFACLDCRKAFILNDKGEFAIIN